jgi:hypothetical protein
MRNAAPLGATLRREKNAVATEIRAGPVSFFVRNTLEGI